MVLTRLCSEHEAPAQGIQALTSPRAAGKGCCSVPLCTGAWSLFTHKAGNLGISMPLVPGLVSVAFGPLNPHCFSSSRGHDSLLLLDVP